MEWTSGQVDVYTEVEIDQICTVVEGEESNCLGAISATTLPSFIKSFRVAPNPIFEDTLRAEYELDATSDLKFALFNLNGQLVQQVQTANTGQLSMNIAQLNAGIYILQLTRD